MHDRLFYISQENINRIAFEIISAKKNNDTLFRIMSKEIFQKSYSKIEFHDTVTLCGKLTGIAIASVIKKSQGQYRNGSFAKSFNETNSYADRVTGSDLGMVLKFLNDAKFDTVLKLLKHNHKFGFKFCLNMLR